RSVAHTFADHGGGHKRFLTGRDPREPAGFVNDYPMVGSMVSRCREGVRRGVPNYVAGTDGGRDHIDVYSFGAAYLGPSTYPFTFAGDPSDPKFRVQNLAPAAAVADRVGERLGLLADLDAAPDRLDRGATRAFRGRAVELMTTDAPRRAFDLSREPPKLRERSGLPARGQRCPLAPRPLR